MHFQFANIGILIGVKDPMVVSDAAVVEHFEFQCQQPVTCDVKKMTFPSMKRAILLQLSKIAHQYHDLLCCPQRKISP